MACIDFHQTWSVGEGSDHLQLIKFWPSCVPGKGVCGTAKFFGSALLQPARSVCVSLSAFFIIIICRSTRIADGKWKSATHVQQFQDLQPWPLTKFKVRSTTMCLQLMANTKFSALSFNQFWVIKRKVIQTALHFVDIGIDSGSGRSPPRTHTVVCP